MLNEHDYRDRRIRAAIKEEKDLLRKRIIVRKLDEPIQCGWRRFFVLTEHAQRRWDHDILAAILEVIGTVRNCRRLDFRTRTFRHRRRLVEIDQSISRLYDRTWEGLPCPANWRRYFHWFHYKEWGRPRYFGEFVQPSLFELRIEPRMVWHVREVDPAVETRLQEIAAWLDARHGRERYGWLKGQNQSYRWIDGECIRQRKLQREHVREIKRALDNFPDVDPNASTRCIWASGWKTFPMNVQFFPAAR